MPIEIVFAACTGDTILSQAWPTIGVKKTYFDYIAVGVVLPHYRSKVIWSEPGLIFIIDVGRSDAVSFVIIFKPVASHGKLSL